MGSSVTRAPLASVRNLDVWGSQEQNRLRPLLDTLSIDQLTRFRCNVVMEAETLKCLLENQRNLRQLMAVHTASGLLDRSCLKDNLHNLTRLHLRVPDSLDGYKFWLEQTPSLKTLELESKEQQVLHFWQPPMGSERLSLRSLSLKGFRLPGIPGQLGRMTDLSSLEFLCLNRCEEQSKFLHSLAEEMMPMVEASLQELSIIKKCPTLDGWHTELNFLLSTTHGLQALNVTAADGMLPAAANLRPHGHTLRRLCIGSLEYGSDTNFRDNMELRYTIEQLQELVNECPNVEELCIGYAAIDSRLRDPIALYTPATLRLRQQLPARPTPFKLGLVSRGLQVILSH